MNTAQVVFVSVVTFFFASLFSLGVLSGQETRHSRNEIADNSAGTQSEQIDQKRFEQTQRYMGVGITIVAYCDDIQHAQFCFEKAFHVFETINAQFSDYDPESSINQLCDNAAIGKPVQLDADVFRLIEESHLISIRTEGAFDYTLGNLTKIWRLTRKEKALPKNGDLDQALNHSGHHLVELDRKRKRITLASDQLRMDFGGIAKGFANDLALEQLKLYGVTSALINAGGDIAISDPPPGKTGWSIAISDLDEKLNHCISVSNCGVATSGEKKQFVDINGTRYSHILNPKTGLGMEGHRSVTVVAKTAATADAMASALNVTSDKVTRELLEKSSKEFSARIQIEVSNDQVTLITSDDFPELELIEDND